VLKIFVDEKRWHPDEPLNINKEFALVFTVGQLITIDFGEHQI
jgi:hypothetical protein